jgi:hypothetical protein
MRGGRWVVGVDGWIWEAGESCKIREKKFAGAVEKNRRAARIPEDLRHKLWLMLVDIG